MLIRHGLLTMMLGTILLLLRPDVAPAQVTVKDTLSAVIVIPNPYNVIGRTWGQKSDVKSFERIRFANLPNTPCTIKIYSSRGNLVKTLNHSGGGTNYQWDGRNDDNQYVVSDVYVFVVESQTLGRHIGKFIVIR